MQAHLSNALKNSIKLGVKHRLIQSVDVLSCNSLDLNELINSHLLRNPFLKIKNNEQMTAFFENDEYDLFDSLEQPITLSHYLSSQLSILKLDESMKLYANIIINSLDEDGYLRISLSELANTMKLSQQKLYRALSIVQILEPSGIAARSLGECFSLQLIAQNKMCNEMAELIKNIDKITSISQSNLAVICGVSVNVLQKMLYQLRQLNPSPGKEFSNEITNYIVSDVILFKANNKIHARINSENNLKIYFDTSYFNKIYEEINNQEDKIFIRNCYREAHNLISDLQQRETHISSVSNYIVALQQKYLLNLQNQPQYITQRDIAYNLDMHESTVSRIVNNKYVSYQGRTLSLQELLGNTAAISDNIALQIQSLIQNENAKEILSDEDIMHILNKDGVSIARRTVAKYRTELNIPSSLKRRQQWARYI